MRFEASFRLKESLADRRGVAITLGQTARLYHRWGRFAEAADFYERDLDAIEKDTPDDVGAFIQVNNLRAEVARMVGDLLHAEECLQRSFARLPELDGVPLGLSGGYTRLFRARLHLDQGWLGEVGHDLHLAAAAFSSRPALRAEVDVEQARLLLAQGGTDALRNARELLDRARPVMNEEYSRFGLERVAAAVAAAVGDHACATVAVERARVAASALRNQWMLDRLREQFDH